MSERPRVLLKYGGNAMQSQQLQEQVLGRLARATRSGVELILVHGGGPFIQTLLEQVKVESEFIDGHRKTTPQALRYIEMALKGEVNGLLVNVLNRFGAKAVGLSGKDGGLVRARRRYHQALVDGQEQQVDLGLVGDVADVDPQLPQLLLRHGYLPVITCIASDEQGTDYNINADLFAGHLAGALQVDLYLVLTDVDGLLRNVHDPESLISRLNVTDLSTLYGNTIKGGMIPKLESCQVALENGARSAAVVNGTRPEILDQALSPPHSFRGTKIQLA